ncbi:PucR C-terminal helix-turn-helix domain-containing protein [Parafrankia irregularis]|uniref:PucR C-terminal helix-turn-helix domain-containing protein n=1 Tax=Parafrankia irregularis TaxID=795642 RepID=A0A0S4QLK0_9ACTN|nr:MULTISPECIES: helix-turn-helix domain-containing protein [Parafrankia]MBE3200261.1 helix-turn-helix domain-containing protein [Parafrankia sp. CH37]CUU56539.1 PucR C-terminal helix-turn-helix domain-containing protein [Parafrankia irregularis]
MLTRQVRASAAASTPAEALTPVPSDELRRRYDELARRHTVELRLSASVARAGGISGLVGTAAELTANPLWLIDARRRVVSRSVVARGSDFKPPDLDLLLARCGPVDIASTKPVVIPAEPARGLARRHLVVPVARDGRMFAWLVMAEVAVRLGGDETNLAQRTALHLATEYVVQRRVARASWNARAAFARQLVRGSHTDADLLASADYLGVRADADRVLVYVGDHSADELCDDQALADVVARELGVEILATRGREGMILLVEVPEETACVAFVHRVKQVLRQVIARIGEPETVVGVSAVSGPSGLKRAYRETREVVLCIDRFGRGLHRVIAVDDLGPARLFVANSDIGSVRRYVHDALGSLLGDTPGSADLLRTLQCFFDTGRSVRESAARLGIHENTVRLRMAKVHDLTGLDVAANANDQLSVQTALLVLRLEGHPALPPFVERQAIADPDRPASRKKDTA